MTKYTIEGYKKGTEQAQVRVDAQASRDWVWAHGHSLEDLQHIHAQPDFDPDTHLYCYLDGGMVAYVDADPLPPGEDGAPRAWLEYPRALPDHQKVIPLLLERILAVLQKKGVTLVVIRGTTMWPGSFEIIEGFGFQEHPVHKRGYKVYYVYDLDRGTLEIPTHNVFDFDPKRDLEEAAKLAQYWYRRPVEWCKDRLLEMEREWPLISHLVVREGDEMVAVCSSAPNFVHDGEPAAIYYIYVRDAQCLRPLIAKTIERCVQAGHRRLLVDLIGEHRGYESDYQALGFAWAAEWARYEKRLG